MHPRQGGRYRVDQPGVGVHSKYRLHSEVPLVVPASPRRPGIMPFVTVLGRTGGVMDGRIHDGTTADSQFLGLQVFPYPPEDGFSQSARLQKVAELTNRCLIQRQLSAQVDAHELPHRPGIA